MPELARCLLYVPGDRPDRFTKAQSTDADLVILDLEDSVTPGRKAEARRAVGSYLHDHASPRLAVRVDVASLAEDLAAIAARAHTLVLPDARSDVLAELARLWPDHAAGNHQPKVIALLESAAGLAEVDAIARHPWTTRLGMGEADLAADLGIQPDEERTELWPYRAMVVLGSRAAGLPAPVGSTDTRVDAVAAVEQSTRLLRRQGFGGRTAIHPAQVPAVLEAFTPSGAELGRARAVLAEFHARRGAGEGTFRDADGRLVDPATVRWAQSVIERYGP